MKAQLLLAAGLKLCYDARLLKTVQRLALDLNGDDLEGLDGECEAVAGNGDFAELILHQTHQSDPLGLEAQGDGGVDLLVVSLVHTQHQSVGVFGLLHGLQDHIGSGDGNQAVGVGQSAVLSADGNSGHGLVQVVSHLHNTGLTVIALVRNDGVGQVVHAAVSVNIGVSSGLQQGQAHDTVVDVVAVLAVVCSNVR